MKIYVAGRFKKIDEINEYYSQLEKQGHVITNKWTEQEPIKPFINNLDKARQYLQEDFTGIKNADAVILIAEYEADARGCHVELGFALNEAEQRLLKIIVVYKKDNPSMFYMDPKITLVRSFEQIFDFLKSN